MKCFNCDLESPAVFCDMNCRQEYAKKQAALQAESEREMIQQSMPRIRTHSFRGVNFRVDIPNRLCLHCGVSFKPRRKDMIYCCHIHAMREEQRVARALKRGYARPKNCLRCGKLLDVGKREYCSDRCSRLNYMKTHRAIPEWLTKYRASQRQFGVLKYHRLHPNAKFRPRRPRST